MNQLKPFFSNKTNWGRLIFLAVFVILCFVYSLNETLFVRPQSIHIWRQTNSLSIALNYYEHNNPLPDPQIHNQFCDDGLSGKTAGEFPLIYWGVAKLWKVFGVHEWIFRLVQLTILFLGLFALFEISFYFLKNQFWAGFVSLLLFTSPMLVFYGVNFLPDGPSLALMLMGWYFVVRFHQKRATVLLWVAAFLFTFAIVIKITSAISLIAFAGWVLFEWVFQKKEKRIVNYGLAQVLPFVTIVLLSLSWYLYVNHYNALHKGEISYFGIWPVWKMTSKQFFEIKDAVDKIFFKEYMNPYLQYLTMLLWVGLLLRFRRNAKLQNWGLVLLPLGALSILLLWFQVLNAHDYYLITLLIVFAFVWLMVFMVAKEFRFTRHPVMYILLLVFFGYNVSTCRTRLDDRYKGWMNDWFVNNLQALGELEPTLDSLHIGKDDRVISIPDPSVTASLYFMDRPGYTDFGSDFTKEDEFKRRISQGAKYMVVNDTTVLKRPEVKAFSGYLIGKYRNVEIFDLRPYADKKDNQ
jgi:hypothetical protein